MLTRKDISFYNAGLVPMSENAPDATDLRLAKKSRIVDHEAVDGLAGLLTVVGVRFTTSRYVAQKTVDLVFRKLGRTPSKATTAVTPLYGGQIEHFDEFLKRESEKHPFGLSSEVMRHLLRKSWLGLSGGSPTYR